MTVLHDIDPIALHLPFWPHGIHWYGLMYLLGFGVAWWIGRQRVRAGRFPGVDENGFGRPAVLRHARRGAGRAQRYVLF
jgi:phosphatidylglycerol:prolipoprotein diacylglycerol transferase